MKKSKTKTVVLQVQKNNLKPNNEVQRILEKMSYHCWKLYNVGLYSIRQHYELTSEYLDYVGNYHSCKDSVHYKLLMTDTGQQILRMIDRGYKSFFALLKLKANGKYSEEVKPPGYKNKLSTIIIQGRSVRVKNGYVHIGMSSAFKEKYQPSIKELKFKLPKNITSRIKEVRIIPKFDGKYWEIEFVYEKEYDFQSLDKENSLAIDLGVNNFASCFDYDGNSFILDGKSIKSINQLYNKVLSKTQKGSNQRIRNSRKRNNKINHIFNHYANFIIKHCKENNIGNIDIGQLNKESCNIGKTNNQNFCAIPYYKFIQKLKSKCEILGIQIHLQDESYTSKCSFLDNEEVKKQDKYLGKRVKRGLFQTSTCSGSKIVNADINGAANLLRKCNRRLSERAASGFVTNPVRIKFA